MCQASLQQIVSSVVLIATAIATAAYSPVLQEHFTGVSNTGMIALVLTVA